jgi:S1-C subfamily serine protease
METSQSSCMGWAQVIAKSSPAVVRVEGRWRLPGSGIIWSDQGLVITAHHILERDEDIQVGQEGEPAAAELLGRDPTTDVAVLRVPELNRNPLEQSPQPEVQVGAVAFAMGRPGRLVRASQGIIAACGGAWRTRAGGRLDSFIQADLVMYPGFSGGPLIDGSGRLIGMLTSGLDRSASLAIPYASLQRLVPMLESHGAIERGYLGVGTQGVRLPQAMVQSTGQEIGLLVVSVERESPAEKGGLLIGDILLKVGEISIIGLDDLMSALEAEVIGRKLAVEVLRGGEISHLDVVPERRAES